MVKVNKFEDLKSWQKARQFVNHIYKLTNTPSFSDDFGLRNQIRRVSSSAMHNIAEGFDSGSDAEFVGFLRIARRSASECQSQLYLALDQEYISQEDFDMAYESATDIKKLINSFIRYLTENPKT